MCLFYKCRGLILKVVVLAVLFSSQIGAQEKIEVRVGLSHSSAYQRPDGLFIELLEAVFTKMPQHQLIFYPPYTLARSIKLLEENKVDAIVNITANDRVDGCVSEPIFYYRNVITTIKSDLTLTTLDDLVGLNVAAFKNSRTVLGEKFTKISQQTRYFHELSKQQNQARLLIEGRSDANVGDFLIFLHSLEQYNQTKQSEQQVKASAFNYYQFTPSNAASIAFSNPEICREFNQALTKLKRQGIYQQIIDKHHKRLGTCAIIKLN